MKRIVLGLPLAAGLAGPLFARDAADSVAPEGATTSGFETLSPQVATALEAKSAGQPVQAENWMVAAANPLAVQTVLGLVEPQSSGLGGGAFLVWYDATSGALTTRDARETAPLAATPRLFQDEAGEPLKFFDAVVGGRSVGTPGTPALLAEAHRRWGRAPWPSLFSAAIDHADQGFAVSPRLAGLVEGDADRLARFPSTSHISIVDQCGNVLSMTTTIENGFGSRLMVRGFLLNNERTDFSLRSHSDGVPIANRIEPGKRPRSSMAPTMVMKDGAPVLAIGSPGGSRIIGYVATSIIGWLDWGLNIQQALAVPHAVNRFGTYDVELGTAAVDMQADLEAIGYEVNARDLTSGLHAIVIGNGLLGAADPRREGIALGE